MDLNKVMIIGRLTRDPEVRNTPNGQVVANFSVATNQLWKDASGQRQERVEYTDIVAWSKLAEICQQYLGKGRRVYVEGRLQTRDWTGNDGVRRFKTEVVAENMIMLDNPRGMGQDMGGSQATSSSQAGQAVGPAPAVDEEEIKIEDIPF